jgi:type II secretory pathway pseudopilin PulG
MSNIPPEMLVAIAILILIAYAAGTLTARFFMAASRADVGGARSHEDV